MTIVLAIVAGIAAGALAGLFGVGGGVLFVPMLLALGLNQHQAEATSLLAIVPVVLVGSWRQSRYGNIRYRVAWKLGAGSLCGVVAGAYLAERLATATLQRLFGVVAIVIALELGWRAVRGERQPAARPPRSGS
ncbi:MAG: sulfite exporter TauE/SafE family protein [Gaiellaceae bacterium]